LQLRKLKKRIADSHLLNESAAALLHLYIRFCHATTRWDKAGFQEMDEHLREGQPVIMVLWHERLWMSPYMFNTRLGKICAITTESRVATLGQRLLRRFGFESEMIDPKGDPTRFNRKIIGRIRDGYSIAISPDGTRGPPRVAKPFPIKWGRATQVPIFCVTFAMRRKLRVPTWDRSHIPLPFNRGAMLARRWNETIPRRMSSDQLEALVANLEDALNELTLESDRLAGCADRSNSNPELENATKNPPKS
jgi:lysophospholipid acyltransferase (LPLAT)-like uncharacterized protein